MHFHDYEPKNRRRSSILANEFLDALVESGDVNAALLKVRPCSQPGRDLPCVSMKPVMDLDESPGKAMGPPV